MKRVNSQIRLRTCGLFTSLTIALIITLGANETRAVHFPDYFPVDPVGHDIKTFKWTYGQSGQFTSEIIGTETVPYTSGAIPAVKISTEADGLEYGIAYNDGVNVKILGNNVYYVSTDSSLTAHPSSWSFGTLTDGMLLDQGVYYLVKHDLSTWLMIDNLKLLISIQDVSVLEGNYKDAVIMWWLDTDYSFTALNLYGIESDLGITLPTASDTGGYAVTDFDVMGFKTGPIAYGDIDASTGSLTSLYELKEISPIHSLSGSVWMESGGDFGYSLNENDLLYFLSFGPVSNYNFTTGLWSEEGPAGWIYVNWPFLYEFAADNLWFALPPESGLWVYYFRSGQWEVLPRIIP